MAERRPPPAAAEAQERCRSSLFAWVTSTGNAKEQSSPPRWVSLVPAPFLHACLPMASELGCVLQNTPVRVQNVFRHGDTFFSPQKQQGHWARCWHVIDVSMWKTISPSSLNTLTALTHICRPAFQKHEQITWNSHECHYNHVQRECGLSWMSFRCFHWRWMQSDLHPAQGAWASCQFV